MCGLYAVTQKKMPSFAASQKVPSQLLSVISSNANWFSILLPRQSSVFLKQEAQPSPRDALCQLNCFPTVVRITQTDRVSTSGTLSATASFYSPTCRVLYTHRWSRLNYRTASMRCRACNQQTFIQPTLLMSTGPKLWSSNFAVSTV